MKKSLTGAVLGALTLAGLAPAQSYNITVNAALNRKPISPLIYGVAFGTQAQMQDLGATVNRMGGNNQSRYNWEINADNKDADWFFESIGDASAVPGERADSFIQGNRNAAGQTMMTIPMLGWIAKLGPNRSNLASFSVKKYGSQTQTDPYMPDAGNGISTASGNPLIKGNNPNDANVPSNSTYQQGWLQHLLSKWGTAAKGGVRYYCLDNEESIWFSTHRDVHPIGPKMDEILADMVDFASMIKRSDPSALVVGPEEWGWDGYFYSGYDQQYAAAHGYNSYPDRAAHGNLDYVAYLLQELHNKETITHQRLLDVFSLHCYPEDGSGSDDVSGAAQALRNRSTRSLWDPNYVDQSWINDKVELIPRMKAWVAKYYPGTKIAVTEYNWGAEGNINGATTQADILGIFGSQGLDIATRWTTPAPSTPTYKAMKMFRNYDGFHRGFGDVSVSDTGSNPDNLASYAAVRSSDGYLTVMLINKIAGSAMVGVNLANFNGNGTSQVWQLTSANAIARLADRAYTGSKLVVTVPGQSITLLVIPPSTVKVVPPSTPTGLQGFPLNQEAALKWNWSAGAMSYTVLRGASATGSFAAVGTTSETSFTASGLTNGTTYYFEIQASNTAGKSNSTAPVKVVPVQAKADTAQYSFESGLQSWTDSGGLISSIATSASEPFLGSYSLAVNVSAIGTDKQDVYVLSPTTAAGKTVTFHVRLPAGCQLSSIQPYVLQGSSGGWTWTGNWQAVSGLKLGGWNTLTVQVPANAATPLYSLGVEFSSSGPWTGVCYVDSVGW